MNSNPFDSGLKLGVDFVLDGNIRRSGDRIRVSVQLLSVEDNSTKWAQAFDEDLKDVLELEDTSFWAGGRFPSSRDITG